MSDTLSAPLVSYAHFFDLCAKAARRYSNIFSLPVAVSPYTYLRTVYNSRYPGGRVLDFGCGSDKPLQKILGIGDELYASCDNDSSDVFSYASVDEIPAENVYEIIASNQVFEHLSFEEGIRNAIELARHVAPRGIFQIGVPNPQHPTRYWANPTHKTPWSYLHLCALVELGGLDPFYCARYNKTSGPRWYERPMIDMICRVFRMDWCDSVYVVGRKAI